MAAIPRVFANMSTSDKKPKLTEEEIDALVIADADDPTAWGDPIVVPASRSPRPAWMTQSKPARDARYDRAVHGQPERSLDRLLAGMSPDLHEGVYVFCLIASDAPVPAGAIGMFMEAEGKTVILRGEDAALDLTPVFRAAWITLTIHSDMEAVGFMAALSTALANAGISCNVVSAAYHDHLFVPYDDRDRAMATLRELQRRGNV
jgi:hypothetical protein